MRRLVSISALASLLAVPVAALALVGSPSALLQQMSFRGNPHTVEAEFHMHHDNMHASVWMNGAAEGKTPATVKAWENITIDVAGEGKFLRAKAGIRIFNGALYTKLLSVEGNLGEDLNAAQEWTTKPWVKIDIPKSAAAEQSFIAGFAAGMRDSGLDASEEDIRALFNGLVDALFTMESTRYQGGAAYSLKLAPDYLNRAMRAVQSSVIGQEMGVDGEELSMLESQLINLHIRVNTNTLGELIFLKWYAAAEAEGVSVVTQGKSQWQAGAVHVEIPKDTITFEEFSRDMGMEDLDIGGWEMPSTNTDDWDMPAGDDDNEKESPGATTRPYTVPSRTRRTEAPQGRARCTATPGTSFYLQQARKGQCILPPESTYRVNDRNDRSEHRM